jgi:hypothetical protein
MSELSYFESRPGNLSCNAEEVFVFVTDIRNFSQFIPEGRISNWKAEKESCSFNVPMIGTVTVLLSEKIKSAKVVFKGDALKKNDFILTLNISEKTLNKAFVVIDLSAELNPMMKMLLAKPIDQFLDILIKEMEAFRDWRNVME